MEADMDATGAEREIDGSDGTDKGLPATPSARGAFLGTFACRPSPLPTQPEEDDVDGSFNRHCGRSHATKATTASQKRPHGGAAPLEPDRAIKWPAQRPRSPWEAGTGASPADVLTCPALSHTQPGITPTLPS